MIFSRYFIHRNALKGVFLLFAWMVADPLMAQGPRITSPTAAPTATLTTTPAAANATAQRYRKGKYPWNHYITATIFWIGEQPTQNNPTPNTASSWDRHWQHNFGGYDNPDPSARTSDYRPKAFIPKLNPFYVALPYNDRSNHRAHKPEAPQVIPWFRHHKPKHGKSVCKGRWVQIVSKHGVCYAQWEDCGPFNTIDWKYVFGGARPINEKNNGAGIDLSPAVRDVLKLKSGDKVHWRFVELAEVPRGPWSIYGSNNPFANKANHSELLAQQRQLQYLREYRDKKHSQQAKDPSM